MSNEQGRPNFWTSLPGILTAGGALVTAVSGLVVALYAAGVIGGSARSAVTPTPTPAPSVSAGQLIPPTTITPTPTLSPSPTVTATPTVVPVPTPKDDHGDSPVNATLVTLNAPESGIMPVEGDADVFKFVAQGGTGYFIQVSSKIDLKLRIYDRDQVSELLLWAHVHDDAPTRKAWEAPASGTYYIIIEAYENRVDGSYILTIS